MRGSVLIYMLNVHRENNSSHYVFIYLLKYIYLYINYDMHFICIQIFLPITNGYKNKRKRKFLLILNIQLLLAQKL